MTNEEKILAILAQHGEMLEKLNGTVEKHSEMLSDLQKTVTRVAVTQENVVLPQLKLLADMSQRLAELEKAR